MRCQLDQDVGTCYLTPAEAESGCVGTAHYLAPVPCGICGGGGKKGLFRCGTCRGTGRGVWRVPLRVRVKGGTRQGDALGYTVQAPEAVHLLPAGYCIRAAIAADRAPTAGQFHDLSDIFEHFFADGADSRGPASADLHRQLRVRAAEARGGCTKTVRYPVASACRFCGGSGEAAGDVSPQCPSCAGKGRIVTQKQTVLGLIQNSKSCKRCGGRGVQIQTPCTACAGKGATEDEECVTVQLPPGTVTGDCVTIPDKGLYRVDGSRGRLTVTVQVDG